ncbi:DUF1801 domain-containing protein [Patescibacteria group bacterium]
MNSLKPVGARNVEEYINQLPDSRKKIIRKVRTVILENLPKGYEEGIQYDMIGYYVPLTLFPDGYLGDGKTPLPYVSLASQKNHMAIYLNNVYSDSDLKKWFVVEYRKSGKRLDMGKSCVRFRDLDDLPLNLIGEVVSKTTPQQQVNTYLSSRKSR